MKKLFLIFSLVLILQFSPSLNQGSVKFYVYGSTGCRTCFEAVYVLFASTYGLDSVVFYGIESKVNQSYFKAIYEVIAPEEKRVYPLTGVFVNGKLTAVVIGFESNRLFWDKLIANTLGSNKVYIYNLYVSPNKLKSIKDIETISKLESLFKQEKPLGEVRSETIKNWQEVLPYVIGLLAIITGFYSLTKYFRGKHRPSIPGPVAKLINGKLSKAINPFSSFLVGVFVSLTLLPSTSAPYKIALTVLSDLNNVLDLSSCFCIISYL